MMELKRLCSDTMRIFCVDDILQLGNTIKDCVLTNDTEKYAEFSKLVEDLSVDWLQMIFQYWYADRKEKMQDYTPATLAKTVARLSHVDNEKVCFDMCAGSGALTIQKWNADKNLSFICEEFDENVLPFLLFNLAVRNITATVIHGDVLSGEFFKAWSVIRGSEYGTVREIDCPIEIKADTCISNPPYNMKWTYPAFAMIQPRFEMMLAPESNANYAFIQTALDCAKKAVLIMPNSILDTQNKAEAAIRQLLVDKNMVESVVINPDNMFEKTKIGTCLISLSTKKSTFKTAMIDMRQEYTEVERKQNGQFGGAAHEGRTYTKVIKTYSDEQIEKLCKAAVQPENIPGFSAVVDKRNIAENKYSLNASKYIEMKAPEHSHRPFADIVADINAIVRERNACKLVINETVARQMHITEKFCISEQNEINGGFEQFVNPMLEKICGMKIEPDSYIRLTKNKNEFSFVNMDKDKLSPVIVSIMALWGQSIQMLNERENYYLAELRDAILPDLMSGQIEQED